MSDEQPLGWHDQVLAELRAIRALLVRIAPPPVLPFEERYPPTPTVEERSARNRVLQQALQADEDSRRRPPVHRGGVR